MTALIVIEDLRKLPLTHETDSVMAKTFEQAQALFRKRQIRRHEEDDRFDPFYDPPACYVYKNTYYFVMEWRRVF